MDIMLSSVSCPFALVCLDIVILLGLYTSPQSPATTSDFIEWRWSNTWIEKLRLLYINYLPKLSNQDVSKSAHFNSTRVAAYLHRRTSGSYALFMICVMCSGTSYWFLQIKPQTFIANYEMTIHVPTQNHPKRNGTCCIPYERSSFHHFTWRACPSMIQRHAPCGNWRVRPVSCVLTIPGVRW